VINEDSQRQFVDFNVVCCCCVTKYTAVRYDLERHQRKVLPLRYQVNLAFYFCRSISLITVCARADDDAQSTLGRRLATHIAHLRVVCV
jgi:hypothetical protein